MEAKSTEEQKAYFHAMLKLSPEREAPQIVQMRNAFLGAVSQTSSEAQILSRESINLLKKELDQCRRNFWMTGEDDVGAVLASGKFDNALDVSTSASRMLAWHRLRNRIYELREVLGKYTLALEVHRIASLGTREAESVKHEILTNVQQGNSKGYRSDAEAIKKKFPDIYALEPEWFEDIIRVKRFQLGTTLSQRNDSQDLDTSSESRFPVWLIVILVIFLVKAMIAIGSLRR